MGADAAMPAAMAWWNLLQDQFSKAVASAMPADGVPAAREAADKPADPPKAAGQSATGGGDTGGTPGTSSQKPSRTKSDKA